MGYMFLPLKRYADFSGRSRRLEFWLWHLFNAIVAGVVVTIITISVFGSIADVTQRAASGEFANYAAVDGANFVTLNGEKYAIPPEVMIQAVMGSIGIPFLLLALYSLAVFLPNLAVIVRRLHDQDKSGWWFFIGFVPIIGGIWLLVLYLTDGTPGPNQYGPDPKGRGVSQTATLPMGAAVLP
jgi:uncharacterized membrane protein YhaH (DUF805 family)